MFDHTHFNGIAADEDDSMISIFVTRLYFTMTTVSTIGYGDITPKSIKVRCATIFLQLIVTLGFIMQIFQWEGKSSIQT